MVQEEKWWIFNEDDDDDEWANDKKNTGDDLNDAEDWPNDEWTKRYEDGMMNYRARLRGSILPAFRKKIYEVFT